MSATSLPGDFGHVDLDDLDLASDRLAEVDGHELVPFDGALAGMPRGAPPGPPEE